MERLPAPGPVAGVRNPELQGHKTGKPENGPVLPSLRGHTGTVNEAPGPNVTGVRPRPPRSSTKREIDVEGINE